MVEPSPQPPAESVNESPALICPQCGHPVDTAGALAPVVECTQCGTQFFPPVPEVSETLSDEEKEEQLTKETQEEELSALRIRQLSTLTRANYRTRSYLIVGTIACLWMIVPLLMFAVKGAQREHHWGLEPTAYALFAMGSLMGGIRFAVKTVEIQREINANRRARELQEAEAARQEPDLSTLSDGSHRARNLEMMFGENQETAISAPDGDAPVESGDSPNIQKDAE